jgi:hypothetical protein
MIKSTLGGEADSFGATAITNNVVNLLLDGNTVAQYIADDLATIIKDANDFISVWADKLASGRNLLQATGTNQPKWYLIDGVLFDGIDNFMNSATFTWNQPEFIYIVFKQVTWTAADTIIDGFDTAHKGTIYQWNATPKFTIYAGTEVLTGKSLTLDTFGIIRILFNGASSTFQIDSGTPVTLSPGTNNMSGIWVGTNCTITTRCANIQVKEIILRKGTEATQQATIYAYLKQKYGL